MSPHTAKLRPEMDYRGYINSSERLATLEEKRMPDFASMRSEDLRKAMKVRRMVQTGTKASMVAKLEAHFRAMLEHHENRRWVKDERFIRERPELMLTSKVKAEPSRSSFMDLPGELRNIIYNLALFDPPSKTPSGEKLGATGDYHVAGVLKIGDYGHLSLRRSRNHLEPLGAAELRIDRTISVLHVVGALNKEIRKEVQTFFWARTSIRLRYYGAESTCVAIRQFLEKIGPIARSALAGLNVSEAYGDIRHQNYQAMFSLLRQCKNLRELDLYLPVSTIMGPVDRDAIEEFFLQGQPLNSPSMNDLVVALHSMPQLSYLRLQTPLRRSRGGICGHNFGPNDKFAKFAFTGAREALLVQEVRTRLGARVEAHFEVGCNKEHTLDYKKWLGNGDEIGGEEELSE